MTPTFGVVNTGAAGTLTPFTAIELRVVSINAVGDSLFPSDPITLTPSKLSNAPATISVTAYTQNSLNLLWPLPTDTGVSDSSTVPIIAYLLEVDEGFGSGFTKVVEQVGLTFLHSNLIFGHVYKYRVKAKNLMGYGA